MVNLEEAQVVVYGHEVRFFLQFKKVAADFRPGSRRYFVRDDRFFTLLGTVCFAGGASGNVVFQFLSNVASKLYLSLAELLIRFLGGLNVTQVTSAF